MSGFLKFRPPQAGPPGGWGCCCPVFETEGQAIHTQVGYNENSLLFRQRRGVAQWLARFVRDEEAGGSSPLTPTIFMSSGVLSDSDGTGDLSPAQPFHLHREPQAHAPAAVVEAEHRRTVQVLSQVLLYAGADAGIHHVPIVIHPLRHPLPRHPQ